MKKVRLYESFHNMNEANRGKIHKAVKQGDYPATVVVIENGKVVKQEIVNTPEAVPATFNVLQKEYPKAKIHVEDKGGQTLFVEGLELNENYEVIFSDGVSQMRKFRSEQQAVDFMHKEIKSNKKLRNIAVYKQGMHSTTQTELVVKFWGDGSYLDNVSKKDPKLAAKKLEESAVNEAKAFDKLNKIAKKEYGEFGFATLSADEMSNHINMDMADELADKMFGEFGFASLSEDEMEKLINKNPKVVMESIVNEARSIKKIQDDYDKVVQKLLDTKESWKDCKASGDAKGEAKCLADLKELTAKKKALISELDAAIGLKDVSAELSESLDEARDWGTFGTPEAKKVIKDMDKTWDKFSNAVSKAHADFRSQVKSIINSEDGSKSGILDSEGAAYISGMIEQFVKKEFMIDKYGDISRYSYMNDMYESLVDMVEETIEEAKKDGTISDDEDERRAQLLQKAKEQMEALLDTYEKEAIDIGGKFRSPGIMAEIRQELERQIKKFR